MKHPVIKSVAAALSASLILLSACSLFPTKDEEDANVPDQSNNIINNDDATNLPQDIDKSANTSESGLGVTTPVTGTLYSGRPYFESDFSYCL